MERIEVQIDEGGVVHTILIWPRIYEILIASVQHDPPYTRQELNAANAKDHESVEDAVHWYKKRRDQADL